MKTFYPIPPTTTPDDTVCVLMRVPNSPQWLSAFWWIIDQYSYWFNWQRTDDKRGTLIATRWRAMFWQAVAENNGAAMCPTDILAQIGIHLDEDISMNIRISPDDSCIIQMWCIDHWENWYDPRTCIPSALIQPTGGGALAAGECKGYQATLQGNGKWLLPVQVSTGDTIEILGASGGWNDGTLEWNCPSGKVYSLSLCTVDDPAVSGDPLMSVNHMRLIAQINGLYYDAYNQLIAVPSGLTDVNVEFQANDATLGDNSGSITFAVKVCRPEVRYVLGAVWGTVPSSVAPGETFVATSQANGSWYQMTFTIAPCALSVNLLSLTGWTLDAVSGHSVYGYNNCVGALTGGNYPAATSVPVPSVGEAQDWAIFSATPFTAVFRID